MGYDSVTLQDFLDNRGYDQTVGVTTWEETQWQQYQYSEYIVRMAKARALLK